MNFTSNKCSDYTPQALPYKDKTLYPFWTDLIRGNASGGVEIFLGESFNTQQSPNEIEIIKIIFTLLIMAGDLFFLTVKIEKLH